MTLKEAIETIEYYIRWRQGTIVPMPNPQQVTIALKIILKEVK